MWKFTSRALSDNTVEAQCGDKTLGLGVAEQDWVTGWPTVSRSIRKYRGSWNETGNTILKLRREMYSLLQDRKCFLFWWRNLEMCHLSAMKIPPPQKKQLLQLSWNIICVIVFLRRGRPTNVYVFWGVYVILPFDENIFIITVIMNDQSIAKNACI